jgi:RNA polymerase sigma factor (sigma-70 family)
MLTPDAWSGAGVAPVLPVVLEIDGWDSVDAAQAAVEQGDDDAAAVPLPGAANSLDLFGCRLDSDALAELVSRVVRQDESALQALYDALHGRVYALALHVTGRIGAAEEVLQDTFWQVWRQAPRFDPTRGNAVAWIMTMARSRALDTRRSAKRDVLQSAGQASDEHFDIADEAADDPQDLLDTLQRDSALHATLAALDPLRRQLIALVFYRGLTHDEVAAHTGLPLGTVKSHLRRTLISLRESLGPDFGSQVMGVRP